MRNKGRKLFSLLLGLVMVLSLFPVGAVHAADSWADLTGVKSVDKSLNKTSIDAIEVLAEENENLPDNIGNKKLVAQSLEKSDEKIYVEEVARALKAPRGAIGIEVLPETTQTFIVWLQQLPTALVEFYGEAQAANLSKDYADLGAQARRSIQADFKNKIVWEYSTVFAGFAINMLPSEAADLAKMPGVFAVEPDTMMHATEYVGYTPDPAYDFEGMKESRELFQMADIHAAGITGKGVIVGVLDTGIDYNHPDLKDAFKGGYNYIQTNADYNRPAELRYDPMETTYVQWQGSGRAEEDNNGNTFYTDHGTHVSGTVASQAKNTNATYKALGMAPEVDLYVARVLGPYGSGATTGIISAIEDFTAGNESRGIPKANVINLSLGSNTNTAYGSDIFALNNATIAGVNVAVSAGNNATPSGVSTMEGRRIATLGSPGTAYLALTVAAAQYGGSAVKTYDAVKASFDGEDTEVSFGLLIEGQDVTNAFADDSITGTPSPVYVEGKGYPAYLGFGANDANTLPELQAIPSGSLAGKILVVKRGLNFTDFLEQAQRTGAGGLVIVNGSTQGEEYITNMVIGGTGQGSMPIFSAFASTSAKLTGLAQGGRDVYVKLGALTEAPQAKMPAYFSSIGPVNVTLGLKPDIIAPGWNIVSTAPAFVTSPTHDVTDFSGAYQSMSGTSMSSPHMCGLLALMVDRFPDATPAELKARLMNTAQPDLIKALANDTPASVLEVGAGFVDPYRALMVDTDVFVTVKDSVPGQSQGSVIQNQTLSSLSFGNTEPGDSSRVLPVTVHGAANFSVSAVYNDNTRFSKNATANGVELKWSEAEDGTFTAWLEVPEDAEVGYYEGLLKVTVDGKDYILPWLTLVGEPIIPFEVLATAERPIISTSTNDSVRSSRGTNPTNPNTTSLWFSWEGGEWPLDYGSTINRSLQVYLIDTEAFEIAYAYNATVNLRGVENDGTDVYVAPNYLNYRARAVDASGNIARTDSDIRNGTYWLGIVAGEDIYFYYELGVVFTNGVGEWAVRLDVDEVVPVSSDPAVTTATVNGRIYSPALAKADDAGFLWTEVDDFWMDDSAWIIDQSFNTIGFSTTTSPGVYIDGNSKTAYNMFLDDGYPWPCDEDGYFSVTVDVDQADKFGGPAFTLGSNHAIVGVEGLYYNDNNSAWPLIGANKSTAVTPVLEPTDLESIEIVTLPSKLEYLEGKDELDVTGGMLKVYSAYEDPKEIPFALHMVTGFDNTVVGPQELTLHYGGQEATYEVTIIAKTLTSIAIKELPDKREYLEYKDMLDVRGGVLTLFFDNDTSEDIDFTADMISGFDNTTLGVQTLTLTYEGFTATFDVEIVERSIASIVMKSLPDKLEYVQRRDTLDVTGGAVRVFYDNLTYKDIALTDDMVTGFSNLELGPKTLTVSYEGKTTSFEVQIIPKTLVSVEWKTLPDKLEYVQFMEELDVTGGVLTVIYDNMTYDEIAITDAMVQGFDKTVAGVQTLTVVYGDVELSFDVEVVEYSPIERIEGPNRYETAIEVSQRAYDKSDTVILAYGQDFPDALAGNVLAAFHDAPILLIRDRDAVVETVLAEIERLEAKHAIFLGGELAIPASVEDRVKEVVETTERIAGANRYETAALVAEAVGIPADGHVFLTNGRSYYDALSIGAVAARDSVPILLTHPTVLLDEVVEALAELGVQKITIVGGPAAVSDEIAEALAEDYEVDRIAGDSREDTALAVAERYFEDATQFLVASGDEFPDGLIGGYFGAVSDAPLLLVRNRGLRPSVLDYLAAQDISNITILGGTASVSETIEDAFWTLFTE